MRAFLLPFTLFLLSAVPARAQEPYILQLTLVHFADGSWQQDEILAAAAEALRILAQCRIAPSEPEVMRAEVAARFRFFHTPTSRELARTLQPRTPAVYFVDGTLQDPAFDAEAIGRGNSRTRPELRDTVWMMRGARDVGVVLAHELAHVLMDSGEHSEEPGNLMRDETAPGNTRLSAAQCERLRRTASRNGLLAAPSR